MATTYTPLRYPGGKTVYADLLEDVIALNGMTDVVLVEPYAGGAGASIKLLLQGKVDQLILNDLDVAIYAFWWAVLNEPNYLVDRVLTCDLTVDEWKRQREINRRKNSQDLKTLGFSTLFLNRCNRSGILTANPIGGIQQLGNYKIDARFNRDGLVEKIVNISAFSRKIALRNISCERLIASLNKRKNLANLLVYFDPPYYQKGPLLYMNHYTPNDHASLAGLIKASRFKWILSYDRHREIERLYSNVKQYEAELRYTIVGNEKAKELIATDLFVPEYLKPIREGVFS